MRRSTARIRAEATALLRQEGIEDPPIPIEHLAHTLGARIILDAFDGEISGMLFRDAERIVIGVNANHASSRRRFTIAHECGHLLLHTGKDLYVDRGFSVRLRDTTSAEATNIEEIEANAFAAEILMPARMIQRDVGEYALDYEDDDLIAHLASRYHVSLQAMIFRLTNLGYIDK